MKIFVQGKNETVIINDEVYVTVVDILEDEVILAVDAPAWVAVCRKEALKEPATMPIPPR